MKDTFVKWYILYVVKKLISKRRNHTNLSSWIELLQSYVMLFFLSWKSISDIEADYAKRCAKSSVQGGERASCAISIFRSTHNTLSRFSPQRCPTDRYALPHKETHVTISLGLSFFFFLIFPRICMFDWAVTVTATIHTLSLIVVVLYIYTHIYTLSTRCQRWT